MNSINREKTNDNLLYPFAKNKHGELIIISEAKRSVKYFCWGCGKPMIPKMGKIRIHHFAHKPGHDITNCSLESALHNAYKTMLYNRIKANLLTDTKSELLIEWNCSQCLDTHRGNLLKKVANVEIEKNVGQYRPDLSLYRKDDTVHAVIEIIATHEIEEYTRQYYSDNKIAIVEFKPTLEDLAKIYDEILYPSSVNVCLKEDKAVYNNPENLEERANDYTSIWNDRAFSIAQKPTVIDKDTHPANQKTSPFKTLIEFLRRLLAKIVK